MGILPANGVNTEGIVAARANSLAYNLVVKEFRHQF
jgi:hypothetical protein